jgi:uncharacterized OB-fold protein
MQEVIMAVKKHQIPVVKGLFTWPSDDPRFIARRCQSCGEVFFPARDFCANPACNGTDMEEILLSKKGKLYGYTIQCYPPPRPFVPATPFVPFGIGLVEFPEGIRICGQMIDCQPEKDLELGMDVEMVIERLDEDKEGNEIVAWKFRPVKTH